MRFSTSRLGFRFVFAVQVASAAASLGAAMFGCSTSTETSAPFGGASDGGLSRDTGPVDIFDGTGGPTDAGVSPLPPLTCEKYCALVQNHCKGEHAQYASEEDCLAFCAHIPAGDPFASKETAGMYCRQSYAGNPSLTDPETYCAAAGPFGGGICGDRCTAFCQVALSACTASALEAGAPPYESLPSCKTECLQYTFREAGADGGGEGLDGPESGNTLNCRLHRLRKAVAEADACEDLGVDAGNCR